MQKSTLLLLFLLGYVTILNAQIRKDSSIMNFTITDAMAKKPISMVFCEVKKENQLVYSFSSNEKGKISFKLPMNGGTFAISFTKKGFENKRFDFDMNFFHDSVMNNPIEMVASDCYLFKGSLYNKDASRFLTYTKVKLKNLNTGEMAESKTNDLGLVYFYVKLHQKYELSTYADNFLNRRAIVNTDCGNDSVAKFCLSGFSYENYMDPEYAPKTIVGTILLDSIDINRNYQLANIYYDPNKADIKPEAAKVLDDLYQLLKDNAKIKIELSSHTDSRGDTATNRALSQRRAESATQYLVKKGIDVSRILPKGYGETKLINDCTDGVACSEEKHRVNRRTEFKIIGFVSDEEQVVPPIQANTKPQTTDEIPKSANSTPKTPVKVKIPIKK